MSRIIVSTESAPAAIGTYSQAVRVGKTVYLSGQIVLDPASGQLVEGSEAQIRRVFANLKAVAEAAGGSRRRGKLNVPHRSRAFRRGERIMASHFVSPIPPRCGGRAALPRGRCRRTQCSFRMSAVGFRKLA
jgi:hypothetical protein